MATVVDKGMVSSGGQRDEEALRTATRKARIRHTRLKFSLGALLIAVVVGYLMYSSTQSTSVYYLTVSELHQRARVSRGEIYQERIRVGGTVAAGSVVRSTKAQSIHFTMLQGAERLPVVYNGIVPDIFGPQIEVVVEGTYTPAGVLQARTLLAKCPSRFQAAPGKAIEPGTSLL